MACKASKLPLFRVISSRGFASAQPSIPPSPPKNASVSSSVLQNKLFVAALDNGAPVARVTIAYKGGSRYEPGNELGLTHFLRAAAGNGTSCSTAFGIIRNLQQFGANLTATVDRETICYTLEATKDKIEDAMKFLNDVASKQVFNSWEFDEVIQRIKYETAGLTPQVRALDLLHKSAFRRGLGNSLFCSPRQAGNFSSESLQHFVSTNFTAERCAVGVAGLPLDRAVALAQNINFTRSSCAENTPSSFKGGDLRKEMGGDLAHIAIGTQGTSLSCINDSVALAILSRALGSGPKVKWGGDISPLGKAVSSQLGDSPFAVNAFSINYSDDGLFGILISAPKSVAGKAVQAATKVCKKAASLGGDDLNRGRAQFLAEVLCHGDTQYKQAEDLALQGLLTGNLVKTNELADLITKISNNDITKVASKICQGKLSMGAAGNLINVPYIDELQ